MISNEEERQLWRFTDLLLCWFSSTRAWVLRASVVMVEVVPHFGVARGRRVTPAGHGLLIALVEYGRLLTAGLVLDFCRLTRKKKGISTCKLVYLLSQCMWLLRSMQTIFRASVSQSQTQWHGDIQTWILVIYKYWWHAKRWQNRNYLLKYTARVATSTRIQLPSTQETTTTIRRESANTHTDMMRISLAPLQRCAIRCRSLTVVAVKSSPAKRTPERHKAFKGTFCQGPSPNPPSGAAPATCNSKEKHTHGSHTEPAALCPLGHAVKRNKGVQTEFTRRVSPVKKDSGAGTPHLLPHIMTDVVLPLPINSICHSSC